MYPLWFSLFMKFVISTFLHEISPCVLLHALTQRNFHFTATVVLFVFNIFPCFKSLWRLYPYAFGSYDQTTPMSFIVVHCPRERLYYPCHEFCGGFNWSLQPTHGVILVTFPGNIKAFSSLKTSHLISLFSLWFLLIVSVKFPQCLCEYFP